ncbi:hypothetical protein KC332_g8285 [Hortaea werneckii]|uniref:Uncharacterized protein n=1 Tax=Hortaea werneckii TaxID=91943 RepID=A0A3M7ICF2_HORWE|nr:hypothetical protein KC358_g8131 [Hortaea werneckii]KAI6830434.1 hypothetical protein KC350_g7577 [Hortaea werneckii]KAI6926860.1 hypothetical protein KC348_g8545 [Hortaea werneckii]KAI6933875.1 hypothetical protein KC341_g7994 [Hortaea werneckii]KAI6968533.1 hypothetical protein KC321_g8400 [Hortaea werneckii]
MIMHNYCTLAFMLAVALPFHAYASLGSYIRAGLAYSDANTTELKTTSKEPSVQPTATGFRPNNDTNDFAALSKCAASWSSYDAFTSTDLTYVLTISTSTQLTKKHLTQGTGAVYTTRDGIPVASGSFRPTKVVMSQIVITSSTTEYVTSTQHPANFNATPSCPSIKPKKCSSLYSAYLSSLGLPSNASIPAITPAPTNSPPCPQYYFRPSSSCSYYQDDVDSSCYISGQSVKVFYFPPQTANGSDVPTSITFPVVQEYAPGITFTSPSIYLSFDYLSGQRLLPATQSTCVTCGPEYEGCVTYGVGGGNALEYQGTSIAGALLTLAPEDVSTLLVSYGPAAATSAANAIASGGADYANAIMNVVGALDVMPQRLDLNALVHPAPTDYYLRPEGAPGCSLSYPQPECGTIFEGHHRPILSVPSQVSILQGEWATCNPAIYGVYDPPVALTKTSVLEGPEYPGRPSTEHDSGNGGHQQTSYEAASANRPTPPTPHMTDSGPQPTQDGHHSSPADDGQDSDPYTFHPPHIEHTAASLAVPGPPYHTIANPEKPTPAGEADDSRADPSPAASADPNHGTQITESGKTFTISREGADKACINGATITRDAPATTVDGQTVSADKDFVAVGSRRISWDALGRAATATATAAGVQQTATLTDGNSEVPVVQESTATGVYVVGGSISLTVGGAAQALESKTLSAVSEGVVRDGSTITVGGATETASTSDDGKSGDTIRTSQATTAPGGSTQSITAATGSSTAGQAEASGTTTSGSGRAVQYSPAAFAKIALSVLTGITIGNFIIP